MRSDEKTEHAELRVRKLRKKVGSFTLAADFGVPAGGRAAIVGASGSGKTTLLRLLAGLERLDGHEDEGEIVVGETEITRLPPQQREVGYVFQDQALFLSMSVLENAAFGLKMRGVARDEREEEAARWLERVGLKAQTRAPVHRLSGGEKQRVAFVRALIWKPKVLLLDEPFSALDRGLRELLRKELVELHRLWPAPLVMVTHDEDDVAAVANLRFQLDVQQGSALRTLAQR